MYFSAVRCRTVLTLATVLAVAAASPAYADNWWSHLLGDKKDTASDNKTTAPTSAPSSAPATSSAAAPAPVAPPAPADTAPVAPPKAAATASPPVTPATDASKFTAPTQVIPEEEALPPPPPLPNKKAVDRPGMEFSEPKAYLHKDTLDVFGVFKNTGTALDAVNGAELPNDPDAVAEMVVKMRDGKEAETILAFDVPTGTATMNEQGKWLRFKGLTKPLKDGDTVQFVLHFRRAANITATVKVKTKG